MAVQLSPKTPTEVKIIGFNFSTQMTPKTVIKSITSIVPSVVLGIDPGGMSLVLGTPTVVPDSFVVAVLASVGVDGVSYGLLCTVLASNGEIHQVFLTLPVSVSAV